MCSGDHLKFSPAVLRACLALCQNAGTQELTTRSTRSASTRSSRPMPAAQGILLFLELKRNYTHDGATLGELIEALGKCVGTVENTIYRLLASGKVVQQDGRFYPRDLHESFHNSVEEPVENGHVFTTLSTDVPTKLWKTPPKYTVLDPLSPPLKEKKKT